MELNASRRMLLTGAGLTALGATVLGTAPSRAREASPAPDAMSRFWRDYLKQRTGGGAVGFSLAIVGADGAPVVQACDGYATRPEAGHPGAAMTPASRMHVASASKAITAVALIQALGEAGLDPDTTLGRVLGDRFPMSEDWRAITMANLLAHRTGLAGGGYVEYPIRETVLPVLAGSLPPSEQRPYAYSNVNYSIARLAIEEISGETYGGYVAQTFLDPAGIADMSLAPPADEYAVTAYQLSASTPGEPVRDDFTDGGGPYGWYATATALARFAASAPGRLAAPQRRRMYSEELGWLRYRALGSAVYGHDGHWSQLSSAGLNSAMLTLPYRHGGGLIVNTAVSGNLMDMIADGVTASWPLIRCDPRPRRDRWTARLEVPIAADEVRYTLDGTAPTAASRLYGGPFDIDLPSTVRALAFREGGPISPVISREIAVADYSLPDRKPQLAPPVSDA